MSFNELAILELSLKRIALTRIHNDWMADNVINRNSKNQVDSNLIVRFRITFDSQSLLRYYETFHYEIFFHSVTNQNSACTRQFMLGI